MILSDFRKSDLINTFLRKTHDGNANVVEAGCVFIIVIVHFVVKTGGKQVKSIKAKLKSKKWEFSSR